MAGVNGPDEMIRRWVATPTLAPTGAERVEVLRRMSSVPLSSHTRTAREWGGPTSSLVGELHPVTGAQIEEGTPLTSAEYHLTKRIQDGEWKPGTSLAEFLSDIRTSIMHPAARLHVGERDYLVAATVTDATVLGSAVSTMMPRFGRCLFVLYSVKHRNIATAYQKSLKPQRDRQRDGAVEVCSTDLLATSLTEGRQS